MTEQPAPKVTREDVVRIVRRDFPRTPETDVLAMLDEYGTIDWQRERDRVQLAVLKLAAGDLQALTKNLAMALQDYREVLAPAEYPKYSKTRPRNTLGPAEEARIFQADWDQYQAWLLRA